jgi:polysaccharide biosynthesis/export protein
VRRATFAPTIAALPLLWLLLPTPITAAQTAAQKAGAPARGAGPATTGIAAPPPADYVIGPEDVLIVQFWRDDQMSGETTVRPDGKITLKLLNDIQAAGLTPDQLRERLAKEGSRFLEDPQVTVAVKQIKSRFVTVLGEVGKQGAVPLNGPMTVLAALGQAGGLTEYAQKKEIAIIRGTTRLKFDLEAVSQGKKLEQNVYLMPGDTVFVP